VDTTQNPESMTATERRAEITSILARGVVRAVRASRGRISAPSTETAEGGGTCLDLPADLPLSVAPRSTGSRACLWRKGAAWQTSQQRSTAFSA